VNDLLTDLQDKGYGVLHDVFSNHECDMMGDALDELERYHLQHNTGFVTNSNGRQNTVLNVHYLAPDKFLTHIANPRILEAAKLVLKDQVILSNFNASRAVKNDAASYRIHIDSRKPNPDFQHTYQLVANICVDSFTATNGGTVVVEGSHKSGKDPREIDVSPAQITHAIAPRGSVVFLLGQTWHDIGHNRDATRRWSIIAYYSCWWIKPTFDFVAACNEEIFAMADDTQKALLGFNTRPPVRWNERQKTVVDISHLPRSLDAAKAWDG
jgi:ectoine hydroxylase-related dioxygenase (phytanoyl-CoA dioxygenase family)